MSKALVVIDVQKYFVVDRAANLPNKIAWHIKENDYDHVLFLKFRNDPQSNFHKLLNFSEVTKAPATDIHETLTEFVTDNNVFEKTTYSAFKAEKFVEYFTGSTIKNWKGLTLEHLETLILIDTADKNLSDELPYSKDNAEILVSQSTEFDAWLNEVVFDLDNFRTVGEKEVLGTSN